MPIYSYAELKGKIKVGDKVRAVPGKFNTCECLNNDGSNTREITYVGENAFSIHERTHWYDEAAYLELLTVEKTLENLQKGDVVVHEDGDKRDVLAVIGEGVYVMSEQYRDGSDTDRRGSDDVWTSFNLKRSGYKPLQPTPEVTELSIDEIAAKFGKKPEEIRIKKEGL